MNWIYLAIIYIILPPAIAILILHYLKIKLEPKITATAMIITSVIAVFYFLTFSISVHGSNRLDGFVILFWILVILGYLLIKDKLGIKLKYKIKKKKMKRKYKFMDIKLPFIVLFITMIAILTYNVSREILEGAPQKFGHTTLEYLLMSYFLPIVVGIVLILAYYLHKRYSQGKTVFGYRPKFYDEKPEAKKVSQPIHREPPIDILLILKRKRKALLAIVVLMILLAVLNYIGFLSVFNYPLSNLVMGEPDRSCSVDSDCVLGKVDCSVCSCKEAVNKDWKPFCPFKKMTGFLCSPCETPGGVICSNNICKEPETDEEISRKKDILLSEWSAQYSISTTKIKENEFIIKEGVGLATFITEIYNPGYLKINITEDITCKVISGEEDILDNLFYHGFKCYPEEGFQKDCTHLRTEKIGNIWIGKEIRLSPWKKAQLKLVFYNNDNRLVYSDTSVVCDIDIMNTTAQILDSNQLKLHFKG